MSNKAYGATLKFLQGSFARGLKRGMTAPTAFGHTAIELPPIMHIEIRKFSTRPTNDYSGVQQDWCRVGESIAKAVDTHGRQVKSGVAASESGKATSSAEQYGRTRRFARSSK